MIYGFLYEMVADHAGLLAGVATATAAVAAASVWLTSIPDRPMSYPVSLDDQSVEIEVGCVDSSLVQIVLGNPKSVFSDCRKIRSLLMKKFTRLPRVHVEAWRIFFH